MKSLLAELIFVAAGFLMALSFSVGVMVVLQTLLSMHPSQDRPLMAQGGGGLATAFFVLTWLFNKMFLFMSSVVADQEDSDDKENMG